MKKWYIRLWLVPAVILIILLAMVAFVPDNQSPVEVSLPENSHQYDLVLIHGLGNKHRWSKAFLDACLSIWGSGRVFVIHINK